MRKSFTLLFASLLAFVGVAKADPVSELQNKVLKVGAAATEVTADQWYILNNVGRKAYVSQEDNNLKMRAANSVVDGDIATGKANYLFKITAAADGKYNIMSGNGKYFALGSNTASVRDEAVNFQIGLIGESTDNFYLFDADNNYAADGQEVGNNFVGWSTSKPTSAGGNDSYRLLPVSFETVSLVSVTYTFKCGEEVVATQENTVIKGNAYPEFEFPFGYTATTTKPEGTVEADAAVEVKLVVSLPFEAADKVENITKWYLMKMHSNNPKYIEPKDGKIEWEDATVTEANKDAHLWAFVGNLKDGFIVVNKNGLAINNSIQMDEVAKAEKFKLAATSETSENAKNGFCLKHSNGAYLNAQNPLATWGSTDAGSTIMLEEYVAVEAINIVTVDWEYDWVELTEMDATVKLAAEFTPANATDKTITWSSDNEELLTVDENGLIKVVGYTGNEPVGVNITATAANGVSATMEAYLMVINNNEGDAAAYEVKLNTTWGQLYAIGEQLQLTATAFVKETETVVDPNTGESIDKVVEVPVEEEIEFSWESDVPEVYVYPNGLVQVLMAYEGPATITVTAPNGKSASCTIYVFAGAGATLNDIYLNRYVYPNEDKDDASFKVGDTFQFEVTFDPVDFEDKRLSWKSSDEDVVTVDQNGKITAVGAGEAEITVTALADTWVEKSCTVTVVAKTTGIDAVEADAETVIYDLTGRRVEKMQKGIYIVNGNKVLVK